MVNRFTANADKVMALADYEAKRLNHLYVGTEHILLAIVKDDNSVGACVLKNLKVELIKVRLEVDQLIRSGPEIITIDTLPLTPRAKQVIDYAVEESRNMSQSHVATGHILLGLVREGGGVASRVLTNRIGLSIDVLRAEVIRIWGDTDNQFEKDGSKE